MNQSPSHARHQAAEFYEDPGYAELAFVAIVTEDSVGEFAGHQRTNGSEPTIASSGGAEQPQTGCHQCTNRNCFEFTSAHSRSS